MLRTIQKWLFLRMSKCDGIELEQSLIRVAVIVSFLGYLFFRFHQESHPPEINALIKLMSILLALATIILVTILFSEKISVFRRLAAAWLDVISITLFMLQAEQVGVLMIGIYLWVIFGNGFRFGNRYLLHSQVLSLVGFAIVAARNEYWRSHPSLVHSVFLMLAILPIYVGTLILRLNKARKEAEHANAAKTRFVANMSHEVRTPLNGIVGIATLLKATPLNKQQVELIETLDSSSLLLLSLLNNVLDIAKIEEGKSSAPNIREFTIADLADETIKIFRSQAEAKGIHLAAKIDSDMINFMGDRDRLQQVLANLIGNAIKFTHNGHVTLSFSHVPGLAGDNLDTKSPYHVVRFQIADTGIGIGEKASHHIFEPFSQEHNSKEKNYGGCGLGLPIAKHLVASMGGELQFTSEENKGSNFWFDLHLQRGPCLDAASTTIAVEAASALDILICEDDTTNQIILRQIIELAGHRVTMVGSGEDMFDQLDQGRFDVVIADLNMSGMGGAEALKLYRFTHAEDTRTRFIMLTADATDKAREIANQASFDAFMTKPVEARSLFGVISELMGMPQNTADEWLADAISCANKKSSAEATEADRDVDHLLDAGTLRQLEILSSEDSLFVHGLMQNYLRDSESLIGKIDTAIKNRNQEDLREHCHALKGISLGVGAKAMQLRADAIYHAEMGEIRFRGAIIMALLREEHAATRNAIKEYLTRRMMVTG